MSDERETEWFDNDAFWRNMYPFMFAEWRYEKASEQVTKLLDLTRPPGPAVLDLCCGPGRHSVLLAEAGYDVTGVDKNAFLLDRARVTAEEAGADVGWVCQDMRDFVRPGAFDLAVSMFTSIGYFDDKSEDLRVLGNVAASLRPNGVFLVDVVGKERLAKIFQPVTYSELPDGSMLVERHEIFDDWTRVRNEWILIRDGRAETYTFHHTVYSGQELRERMLAAGFDDVTLYGNLDGDPYDTEAKRLIAVGRKGDGR